jgi:hypothetical protein
MAKIRPLCGVDLSSVWVFPAVGLRVRRKNDVADYPDLTDWFNIWERSRTLPRFLLGFFKKRFFREFREQRLTAERAESAETTELRDNCGETMRQ